MKYLVFVLFAFCSFALNSCMSEDDTTIVLPEVIYAKPIDDVVPVELQEKISVYMPIYKGSTPPNIEGTYLVNPLTLVYTSDNNFYPGYVFSDKIVKFTRQNKYTNVLTYESKDGSTSSAKSDEVNISGTSDNFTAYYITTGTSQDISTRTATVLSGRKNASGIEDYIYAFIMLEKGPDPEGLIMDVNEYRIIKDGDELASNASWEDFGKMALLTQKKCKSTTEKKLHESSGSNK